MHILGKIPYGPEDGKAKGVKSLYFEMRSLSFFRTQLNETSSSSPLPRRLWRLFIVSRKMREKDRVEKGFFENICCQENIIVSSLWSEDQKKDEVFQFITLIRWDVHGFLCCPVLKLLLIGWNCFKPSIIDVIIRRKRTLVPLR